MPATNGTAYEQTANVELTASETEQTGYAASVWGGDCAADGTITLLPGDDKTCTITNDDIPGTIIIVKDAVPNDCHDFEFTGDLGSFSLDDDEGVLGCTDVNYGNQTTFSDLAVNTYYTVTEDVPAYWMLESPIVCTGVDPSQITQVADGVQIYLLQDDEVTCTFINRKTELTRTQGFWKTHTEFTSTVFVDCFPGGMNIGSGLHAHTITNTQSTGESELFGAYYASISRTSDGMKRKDVDPLDQARMVLLRQLVTAKLNCCAFGCSSDIQTMIATADNNFGSGSKGDIFASAHELDVYNNSGDTLILDPPPGHATPNTSRDWADIGFWDNP